MTTTTDLWFAWMRGWMAAAHSFAEAQQAALKELAPWPRQQEGETAAAAPPREPHRDAGAEDAALGTAAGNKPSPEPPSSPSRRPRGRPRRETK